MSQKSVYLDYAAATPMDQSVLKVMEPYFTRQFYNPSATYLSAKKVSADIAYARAEVAKWLGAKPTEIVFTAGGTESNNLAIRGVMDANPGANLIVSSIEHESVFEPAKLYGANVAPVKHDGLIDLAKLESLIDDKTVLISIMYANNEIGTIEPLGLISKLKQKIIADRRKRGINLPLYLHSDACQVPAYLNLHVSRLGVDLLTLNSGKIYGPKQSGALFLGRGITIKPQIVGGGQEMTLRSGTENVANIIGFAHALKLVQENRPAEVIRLKALQQLLINSLSEKVKNIRLNGSFEHRLPSNVNVTIAGQDNETMLMKLDEMGVQCAAGSACSASSSSASTTLLSIGLTETEARASLRLTMGKYTTRKDVIYAADCISKIV